MRRESALGLHSRTGGVRHGLTLIELLVTLALTGLLTALLAQAMGQAQRIERLLESGQLSAQERQLRWEWLRTALECALPVPAESDESFAGDAEKLTLLTTQSPQTGGTALAQLQITLHYDARSGQTRLEARNLSDSARRSSWLVDEWPRHSGRITYLDGAGQWRDQWSPGKGAAATLPSAIRIDAGVADVPSLLVHLEVSPHALPRRRDLEGA